MLHLDVSTPVPIHTCADIAAAGGGGSLTGQEPRRNIDGCSFMVVEACNTGHMALHGSEAGGLVWMAVYSFRIMIFVATYKREITPTT